jgi:hypothetical protein
MFSYEQYWQKVTKRPEFRPALAGYGYNEEEFLTKPNNYDADCSSFNL